MTDKDKKDEERRKEILTTEKCPRCLHPLRKDQATGQKVCGSCGLKPR